MSGRTRAAFERFLLVISRPVLFSNLKPSDEDLQSSRQVDTYSLSSLSLGLTA
jgi:hypothetical protein